ASFSPASARLRKRMSGLSASGVSLDDTTNRLGMHYRSCCFTERGCNHPGGPNGRLRRSCCQTQAQLTPGPTLRGERLARDDEHLLFQSALLDVACADVPIYSAPEKQPAIGHGESEGTVRHMAVQRFRQGVPTAPMLDAKDTQMAIEHATLDQTGNHELNEI